MQGYGINSRGLARDGCLPSFSTRLERAGLHFGALQEDDTEMFRYVWTNRNALELDEQAHTRIASIRPCLRVSALDGAHLRETVVECAQYLRIFASELSDYGLVKPNDLGDTSTISLEGGITLVFDEYGELKYLVRNKLPHRTDEPAERASWQARVDYLWEHGYLERGAASRSSRLAEIHQARGRLPADDEFYGEETWR